MPHDLSSAMARFKEDKDDADPTSDKCVLI